MGRSAGPRELAHAAAGPSSDGPAATPPPRRVGGIQPDARALSLQAFAITQPCPEDTGDFFDLHASEDGLHVSVGDASGKGPDARAAAAACRAYLRAFARAGEPLDEVMTHANAMLVDDLDKASFVAAIALRREEASGSLRWSGAGHEHLIHFHAASGKADAIRAGGVVLGVVSDAGPFYHQHELVLEPGDCLVLVTDGVSEAKPFEADASALCEWIAQHGALDPQPLANALIDHCGSLDGAPSLADDATVVVLARSLGGPGDSKGLAAAHPLSGKKRAKAKRGAERGSS